MKMTLEHYKFIKDQLSTLDPEQLRHHAKLLEDDVRVKDCCRRFVWDCFAAKKLHSFASSNLYSYLNDSHIETALKKIAKELNFPTS